MKSYSLDIHQSFLERWPNWRPCAECWTEQLWYLPPQAQGCSVCWLGGPHWCLKGVYDHLLRDRTMDAWPFSLFVIGILLSMKRIRFLPGQLLLRTGCVHSWFSCWDFESSGRKGRWELRVMKTALGLPLPGVSRSETILRRCLCPEGAFLCHLAWRTSFWKKEIWTRVKSQTAKKWPIRLLGRVPAKEAGSASQCSAQAGMRFLAHGPLVWWDAGSQFTDHAPLLMEKPWVSLSRSLLPWEPSTDNRRAKQEEGKRKL